MAQDTKPELKAGQNVRIYTRLRIRINDLMKLIRVMARGHTRGMTTEEKELARVEFIGLTDLLWETLIDLHRDDCQCDDCLLERVSEDR